MTAEVILQCCMKTVRMKLIPILNEHLKIKKKRPKIVAQSLSYRCNKELLWELPCNKELQKTSLKKCVTITTQLSALDVLNYPTIISSGPSAFIIEHGRSLGYIMS